MRLLRDKVVFEPIASYGYLDSNRARVQTMYVPGPIWRTVEAEH